MILLREEIIGNIQLKNLMNWKKKDALFGHRNKMECHDISDTWMKC